MTPSHGVPGLAPTTSEGRATPGVPAPPAHDRSDPLHGAVPVAVHSGTATDGGGRFAVVVHGGVPVGRVQLIGRFNAAATPVLRAAIAALRGEGFHTLILDPSRLAPIGPTGAMVLHHIQQRFSAVPGWSMTINPAPVPTPVQALGGSRSGAASNPSQVTACTTARKAAQKATPAAEAAARTTARTTARQRLVGLSARDRVAGEVEILRRTQAAARAVRIVAAQARATAAVTCTAAAQLITAIPGYAA